MYALIVSLLIFFGGQPFAGASIGDGLMHRDCVEIPAFIMCSDGFTV